jgi:hypothetical protein
MKKYSLFLLLTSLFLFSCDENTTDEIIQSNHHQAVLTDEPGCGWSFTLDSGKKLEPFNYGSFVDSNDPNFHYLVEFIDGRRYNISYESENMTSVCLQAELIQLISIELITN